MIMYNPATFMKDKIELRTHIDDIIIQLLPAAARYKCGIENNVPPGTNLITDTDAFLFILNRLLKLIIQSSYNSRIGISAIGEGDTLSIIINDDNNDYKAFISGKMEKHKATIKKTACRLSFEFNDKNKITVILRFTDQHRDQLKP